MSARAATLGVAICACDNEDTLPRTLESVHGLATRIVVVDSGSTDHTMEIARAHGAAVIERPWPGRVAQLRFALAQVADCDWILSLDSDESLDEMLRASIRAMLDANDAAHDAWAFNRKVHFLGDWLHHVFQPEWRTRLVRSGRFRVEGAGPDGAGGHDRLEVDGRTGRLQGTCRHDSWRDMGEMLESGIRFGRRAALHAERGGSMLDILVRPSAAFVKQYVLRGGFRDGARGLLACGGVAAGTLAKHLLIAERRLRARRRS